MAGLLAGAFGYLVGEPRIEAAIAIEEAATHTGPVADDHHADELVGRDGQRAGLFLATGLFGTAMGGLLATAYVLLRRRLRATDDGRSALLLAGGTLLGAVLVPFLKYPANPPAVGDPDTIDQRTVAYLALVVLGLVAVWAGTLGYRSVRADAPVWQRFGAGHRRIPPGHRRRLCGPAVVPGGSGRLPGDPAVEFPVGLPRHAGGALGRDRPAVQRPDESGRRTARERAARGRPLRRAGDRSGNTGPPVTATSLRLVAHAHTAALRRAVFGAGDDDLDEGGRQAALALVGSRPPRHPGQGGRLPDQPVPGGGADRVRHRAAPHGRGRAGRLRLRRLGRAEPGGRGGAGARGVTAVVGDAGGRADTAGSPSPRCATGSGAGSTVNSPRASGSLP